MNLGNLGTLLKKDTKTRVWWAKLGVALILSNLFFFVLFASDSEVKPAKTPVLVEGLVEVQLDADLKTPFQIGKKILLVHRNGRKKIEGVLQAQGTDQTGKITVLVKETEAQSLFHYENWEVLPYLRNLSFAVVKKETSHEIRY